MLIVSDGVASTIEQSNRNAGCVSTIARTERRNHVREGGTVLCRTSHSQVDVDMLLSEYNGQPGKRARQRPETCRGLCPTSESVATQHGMSFESRRAWRYLRLW